MKEDKCTKSLAKESGLCDISYARYTEKCFIQIDEALYGDTMLVSLFEGHNFNPHKSQLMPRDAKAWKFKRLLS